MKYTLDATDYTDFRAIIEALAEIPFQDETTGVRIFSAV